jgi:hypothetical protein
VNGQPVDYRLDLSTAPQPGTVIVNRVHFPVKAFRLSLTGHTAADGGPMGGGGPGADAGAADHDDGDLLGRRAGRAGAGHGRAVAAVGAERAHIHRADPEARGLPALRR